MLISRSAKALTVHHHFTNWKKLSAAQLYDELINSEAPQDVISRYEILIWRPYQAESYSNIVILMEDMARSIENELQLFHKGV